MKPFAFTLLTVALAATSPFAAAGHPSAVGALPADTQTFVGVVIDDSCSGVGHARMRMGPTDAECARACVSEHGVPFVLEDGAHTYGLSDQTRAGEFAAKRVRVIGTLDGSGKTIQVQSIEAAG